MMRVDSYFESVFYEVLGRETCLCGHNFGFAAKHVCDSCIQRNARLSDADVAFQFIHSSIQIRSWKMGGGQLECLHFFAILMRVR